MVGNFLRWSEKNSMSCNPGKSKELTMRKNGFLEELCKIHNLPQCSELKLLGVIFQYNCKHASHVRGKLVKANKCLHVVLRSKNSSARRVQSGGAGLYVSINCYG